MRKIFVELKKLVDQLDRATVALERNATAETAQCQACLLTRAVFTEFYSVCEFNGKIDEPFRTRIDHLFSRIRAVIPKGRYKKSVDGRHKEFTAFCEDLASRAEDDTVVCI